jgi:hypothetical protein
MLFIFPFHPFGIIRQDAHLAKANTVILHYVLYVFIVGIVVFRNPRRGRSRLAILQIRGPLCSGDHGSVREDDKFHRLGLVMFGHIFLV